MSRFPATALAPIAWLLAAHAVPCAWAQSDTPPAPAVPPELAQVMARTGLPWSALSVWVQPADGQAPRLSLNADQPRQMASVMKLVTTGVALRTLGPAFRWRTPVALRGRLDRQGVLHGDVHVRASGDPALDHDRLLAALRRWRDAGLRDIRGDVVVDRSVYALPPFDAAAFDGEPLKPYNAGPDAWLLSHQSVTLTVRPDLARPAQGRASLSPPLAGVQVNHRVTLDDTSPCDDWRTGLSLDIAPDAGGLRSLSLRGRYPRACATQDWPLRWPEAHPGEHSARLFRAAWTELGGRLRGTVRDGPWPAEGAQALDDWASPPLAEVVRDINKFSNNVMARQLFLALGRPLEGGSLTLDAARVATAEHVRRTTASATGLSPCDGQALTLDNGSGLSRTEGASARCIGHWLLALWRDPVMPEWLASLPIAGVDGTARRMSAAVGRAHIKTGSLEGVTAVAGVVQGSTGQRHVVVVVINTPAEPDLSPSSPAARRPSPGREVVRAVLDWVAAGP